MISSEVFVRFCFICLIFVLSEVNEKIESETESTGCIFAVCPVQYIFWLNNDYEQFRRCSVAICGRGIPIAVPGDDIRSSYYNDTMMNTLFKDKALASWPLVLVTRQICPLSIAARKLLDDHHIPYHYYQYDTEPFGIYFVQTSVRKAGTRRLPQVYLCGSYIGGYHQLNDWQANGNLKSHLLKC